jgi:hypothetical protein
MPAVTPSRGYRYQLLPDSPNGATLGEDLAFDIDADMAARVTAIASLAARVTALEAAAPLVTSATVATSQTTGSLPFVDLATFGPAVTVTTEDEAEVFLICTMSNTGANHTFMSFAVSGATVMAPADNLAVFANVGSTAIRMTAYYHVTGLTPGSNTFTAKYRTGAPTATFLDRTITVRIN